MNHARLWLASAASVAALACQSQTGLTADASNPSPQTPTESINAFFEDVFQAELAADPVRMSYMGMQDRNGEWTDNSEAARERELAVVIDNLEYMRENFDFEALEADAKLSYRLFEYNAELEIQGHRWRHHNYPVHQMRGGHTRGPNVLLTVHKVANVKQAEAYVQRLQGMGAMLKQVEDGLRIREEKGVLPPRFVFPYVIQDCRNVITGQPFDDTADNSILWEDFSNKLGALKELTEVRRSELSGRAKSALVDVVGPAYRSLIEVLEGHQRVATDEHGVWKLPDGPEYYSYCLMRNTTTNWTASTIFELGQAEVDRIHAEMRVIQNKVGFQGKLKEFFEHLRTDPKFYYENTDEGRAAYLAEATALVDDMRERLPAMFNTMPKAAMEVRAVEAYREKSTGKAFYNSPAPDGSRPGVYYANLYNMADMPKYQMAALAYHEGIPGHHMQLSIAQELEDVPRFRMFGGFTAYSEGWGLYTEWLPKEMGLYQDPYSDFGRLAMELWRACRLVVDTGMHEMKWTREQAIEYLRANTPNPEGDCRKAIERYIVMPGQATAYKIGMIRIMELRKYAETELGDAFDEGLFHDVVLLSGPVPLEVLGERVREWVHIRKGMNLLDGTRG